MGNPLLTAEAILLPVSQSRRLLPSWRPTVLPFTGGKLDSAAPALGIAFAGDAGEAEVGRPFSCSFQLLAWPDPLCERFAVGTEFAFMEGTAIVGKGKVMAVGSSA